MAFTPGKGQVRFYKADPDWRGNVLEGIARDASVRRACAAKGAQVSASARQNVSMIPVAEGHLKDLTGEVAASAVLKPVKDFKRKQHHAGTTIPVVLVAFDAWASTWFEFGRGRAFPMSRFLYNAARAAAGGQWLWGPRGRSKAAA